VNWRGRGKRETEQESEGVRGFDLVCRLQQKRGGGKKKVSIQSESGNTEGGEPGDKAGASLVLGTPFDPSDTKTVSEVL